nr:methylated-DNA--[protein]-cysteine S-methyltransferase [bacterium]
MPYISLYQSPLGPITLASDGRHITGLWFNGQKYFAATLTGKAQKKSLPVFEQARSWLDIYFGGQKPDFVPPLSMSGSPFRQMVWEKLRQIPYGQLTTYSRIAQEIAAQRGLASVPAQAVGGAVAHNPISIIVPCHRVVGQSGSLTGYAGGIERKLRLLTLEKADTKKLSFPKGERPLCP